MSFGMSQIKRWKLARILAAVQSALAAEFYATLTLPAPSGGDDTAAINAVYAAAATAGAGLATGQYIRIVGQEGASYLCDAIEPKSNTFLDARIRLAKRSDGGAPTSNSLMRTYDQATALSGGSAITLTFTGTPGSAATSATLNATWTGDTYAPPVIFPNGDVRNVQLTNGATTATWVGGLSSSAGGTTASVATYYGRYKNIKIRGVVFDSNGHDNPAQLVRFENVEDLVVEDCVFIHSSASAHWAVQSGGNDITFLNCTVKGGTVRYQDGFHSTHGQRHRYTNCFAVSGDDAFAAGTDFSGNSGIETFDDEGLRDVTYTNCGGYATVGTLLKIYYGLNQTTNAPFSGNYRGTVNGIQARGHYGVGGISSNGAFYIVDTQTVTFTGTPGNGATSATLNAAWAGKTGTYWLNFPNTTPNERQVTLTNGSTGCDWTAGGALSSACTSAVAACVDPTRIQNVDIEGVVRCGSSTNDGTNSAGVYILAATNVRIAGTITITDTASGGKFAAGNIFLLLGNSEFKINYPVMPAGKGFAIMDSESVEIHSAGFVSGGGAGRGSVEISGVRGLNVHDCQFKDIPTSQTAVLVQSSGSGVYANLVTVKDCHGTKANGATSTRFYNQNSGGTGFVKLLNMQNIDIRAEAASATSVDALWNSTGVTPDVVFVDGVRGFGAGVNRTPNQSTAVAYTGSYATTGYTATLASMLGNRITMTLTGNLVVNAPTGMVPGGRIRFSLTQDATGGRTVTWNSVFKFYVAAWADAGGANTVTEIEFEWNGTNWIQQAPNRWV